MLADLVQTTATTMTEARQRDTDPSATFAYIEAHIAELYSVDKLAQQLDKSAILDRKTYLELYTAIRECTTASRKKDLPAAHRGAHLLGEDIYRSLVLGIRVCCREVLKHIMKSDDDIFSAYVRFWTSYLTLSELLSNVFRYLERHWVTRELDETKTELERKGKELYTISQLHMAMWREEVLGMKGPSEAGVGWETGGEVLQALLGVQSVSEQQRLTTLASFDKLGLALSGNSLVVL